jgi:hypothetical protein
VTVVSTVGWTSAALAGFRLGLLSRLCRCRGKEREREKTVARGARMDKRHAARFDISTSPVAGGRAAADTYERKGKERTISRKMF